MSTHKHFDKLCVIIAVLMAAVTLLFMSTPALGIVAEEISLGYEDRLFDISEVHTVDISMDDWDSFIATCENEEYTLCNVTIDGETFKNVGIRAKGNTSLSSVSAMNSERYSFKIEFDQYDNSISYHGLDKLSLNNLIQDNTYMKDFLVYQMMGEFGAAAPLCSYVYITVNGEDWGLYLAVEGVEDSFLQRNYGSDSGDLYKPDSLSFGGGRGNGKDFDMGDFDFSEGSVDFGDGSFDFSQMTPGQMPSNLPQGDFSDGSFPNMGGQRPQGGTSDSSAPDMGGQWPQGGQMPSGGQMPDGVQPPDGVQLPDGAEWPQMGEGQTGSFPNMGGSWGGSIPDGGSGSGDIGSIGDIFGDMFGGMGGMMGGFGGMGGSDVKLQYIDDNPNSYSNIFSSAKTISTAADQKRLIQSLKTLNSYENLESALDIDAVLRYFVVHNFVVNGDSYTGSMIHNYYLYEEDGLLSMIPWDYNLAYGTFMGSNASGTVNESIDEGASLTDRPMIAWIFSNEEYTRLYHEYFGEFITSVFDSGWFTELVTNTVELITPYVERDPTKFCTVEEFEVGVETIIQFCLLRAESVSAQLAGEDTVIDTGDLNISAMGTMGGSMGGGMGNMGGGNWGDLPEGDWSGGTGNMPGQGSGQSPDSGSRPQRPRS